MNKDKRCKKCMWRDGCRFETPCDYYYDGNDEADDYRIEQYIEAKRKEFYLEWARYISQYE